VVESNAAARHPRRTHRDLPSGQVTLTTAPGVLTTARPGCAIFWFEAEDEPSALALVGPTFRAGTRAYLGEIYEFGDPDVLPLS
jgi:hypothetical protein